MTMAVLVDTGEDRDLDASVEESIQLHLALCCACEGEEVVTVLTAVSLILAGIEQGMVDLYGNREAARKIIRGVVGSLELEAQDKGGGLQ
jgi:hypothetical protein